MNQTARFLLLTLVFTTPVAGAGTRVHYESGKAPRVDLDVVEVAPKQVFEALASILERPLNLDSAVVGPLTVRLENVTVTTALTAICESLDCRVAISGQPAAPIEVTSLSNSLSGPANAKRNSQGLVLGPITLSLKDASLLDVLQTFGRIVGAKSDIEDGIEGSVTLELANIPANEALDHLCRQHGLSWKLVESGAGEAKFERLEIRKQAD